MNKICYRGSWAQQLLQAVLGRQDSVVLCLVIYDIIHVYPSIGVFLYLKVPKFKSKLKEELPESWRGAVYKGM